MSKSLIVRQIAESENITLVEADRIYDLFVTIIQNGIKDLSDGESFELYGVGNFKVKDTPERTGRNPRTGEAITIPAGKKVSFKVSKKLKDQI